MTRIAWRDVRVSLARAPALVLLLAWIGSGARGQEPAPSPAPSPAPPTAPDAAPPPAASEAAPVEGTEKSLPKPPQVRTRKGFSIRITNPAHNDFRFGRSEI